MRIIVVFLFIFLLFANKSNGQHAEFGVFMGSSYYVGELNTSSPLVNKINPVLGVLYRKNINKRYSIRYGLNYGYLGAEDGFINTDWSSFRNISFTSDIVEASGLMEFNFLPYQINNYNTSSYTPFVFIGIAMFRVSPEITYNNNGTKTEGKSIIAPSIPFGVGIKFNLIQNFGLNIEWGVRKTFSDEIDGLPSGYLNGFQIGNSNSKDWYSFAGISLNYKILTKTDRCPVVK